MSYIVRRAVLVTASYKRDDGQYWIDVARCKAKEIFEERQFSRMPDVPLGEVTTLTSGGLNNVQTFLVAPSGDNGHDADEEEAAHAEYVEWLREQSYGINEDGEYEGSPLTWVALTYGEDEYKPPRILADSGEPGRPGPLNDREFVDAVKAKLDAVGSPILHIHKSEDERDFAVIIEGEHFSKISDLVPRSKEATDLYMQHEHVSGSK